jgi:tetratricopeptide (TPR) repeat protein
MRASRAHADPKAARDALILARSLLELEPESADLLKDLGANAFWQGQIALDQKRIDDAQTAFEDYRRSAERMAAIDPNNVDAWIELSYAYTNLGSVENTKGDHNAAKAAFENSIALKRRALERRPDDRTLRGGLALGLSWLGSAYEAQGDLHLALDLFGQEQAELEALRATAPSEYNWTYRLAAAKGRRAYLLIDLGDSDAAYEEYHASRALAQALTQQDPSNRLWQRALLNAETGESSALTALNRLAEALTLQTAAAEKYADLTRQDSSNKEWRMIETINLLHLGDTLLRLKRPMDARQRLDMAFDRMRASPIGAGADTDQRAAQGFILLANVKTALGEKKEADCAKAIDILTPYQAADSTDDYTQDLWARAHLCLGQPDQARKAIAWLKQIGYRRFDYLEYLSSTH